MSNYTPGPWTYLVKPDGYDFAIKAGKVIVVGGCGCCGSPFIDNLHDAPLIAAAPDLLEALKLALSSLEAAWHEIDGEWGPIMAEFGDLEGAVSQGHCSTDAIRAARAAISNATGEA